MSSVVPGGELMEAALQLAGRVSVNPPRQLRMAKRLLQQGMHSRLKDVLELSAVFQGACHQTEDHKEAMAALLEKRPAHSTGN